MAASVSDSSTLLNGLSAFWHRFFRDLGDLRVMYEGTEVLLGQTYLNLLGDVLSTSLLETPLFRKEYFRLLTLREDRVKYRVTDMYDLAGRFVYAGDGTSYGDVPKLQDVIWNAAHTLEAKQHYDVAGETLRFYVDPTGPAPAGFAWRSVAVGMGGAFTSGSVAAWGTAGVQKGDVLVLSHSVNVNQSGWEAWRPNSNAPLADTVARAQAKITTIPISLVRDEKLYLEWNASRPDGGYGLPFNVTYSWRVERPREDGTYGTVIADAIDAPTTNAPFIDGHLAAAPAVDVIEVSMWAVDALVDEKTLYKNFGHYFTKESVSTEMYRSLLRGLCQLYLLGPTVQRMESALSLAAGLEVVASEGELLLGYTDGVDGTGVDGAITNTSVFSSPTASFAGTDVGGYLDILTSTHAQNVGHWRVLQVLSSTSVLLESQSSFATDTPVSWRWSRSGVQTVTTSEREYTYALDVPVKAAIKLSSNWGALSLRGFDTLTEAVTVIDYTVDPDWYAWRYVPSELLEGRSVAWRAITPLLYETVVGAGADAAWYAGDPGLFIGATEVGQNPVTGESVVEVAASGNGHHRKASFVLMDRLLKFHLFTVDVHQSAIDATMTFNALAAVIQAAKPARTFALISAKLGFEDVIDLTDATVTFATGFAPKDEAFIVDAMWTIGDDTPDKPAWNIGDTWKWDLMYTENAVDLNPGSGGIPVVVGGNVPTYYLGATADVRIVDRAVYVDAHP